MMATRSVSGWFHFGTNHIRDTTKMVMNCFHFGNSCKGLLYNWQKNTPLAMDRSQRGGFRLGRRQPACGTQKGYTE